MNENIEDRVFETRGLTVEQERRAQALRVAREIVVQGDFAMRSQTVDVVDVVAIAQFILTGQDPWVETSVQIDADALGVE